MRILLFLTLICLSANALAQSDTLLMEQEDLLEGYLQGQDEESEFDYNDLFEQLDYLRRRPLNLNEASDAELDLFPFLTDVQKLSFLEYRESLGDFISIYELQSIPNFNARIIQQLLPFVKVNEPGIATLPQNWKTDGQHQVIMRWSRTLEERAGFAITDTSRSRYLGDPNSLYLRYRFSFANRISFGFTAEKDAGEEFFTGSNKRGFDFYSAHFFLQNPTGKLRALAIGDYSVSMGQGLVLFNGFATRKSALTTSVKRYGKPLRRYSSVNEVDFFRGAGVTLGLNDKLTATVFASSKLTDGNAQEVILDTLFEEPPEVFVTSLQTSGLHRTQAEIDDKNAIRRTTAGAILRWKERRWNVSLNGLYNHLDQPLNRRPQLYSQYFFNGTDLLNLSVDYSYTYRNYHVFGETAMSDNGAIATINGLLVALDQKADVALLHRRFPVDYQSLNAQPFAETSGGRNETGTYFGLTLRPATRWQVNAYFDLWKHDWLRFRTDSPSEGHEWLVRLTYTVRKKMSAHLQLRNEVKPINQDAENGRFDATPPRRNLQGRAHLSYKLSKQWEWRSRVYAGYSELGDGRLEGTVIYQDLIFRSAKWPISFATRYVVAGTDDYAIRFYAFENDVLNAFSVPAYYGRSTRFYFNGKWKIRRGLTAEFRYARTRFNDRDVISDGLDEIDGPVRSDVRIQLRVKW